MSIYTILLVALAGLIGSVDHWRTLVKKGLTLSYFQYMFKNGIEGTYMAVSAYVAGVEGLFLIGLSPTINWTAALSEVTSGSYTGAVWQPISAILVACYGIGYKCDSNFNKSAEDVIAEKAAFAAVNQVAPVAVSVATPVQAAPVTPIV